MGKQPSLFVKLLRRRVHETYGTSTPSINELVDGLRSKYPEYARHKPQLFTRMLNQTLDFHKNNTKGSKRLSSRDEDENDDDDITLTTSSRKKAKKIDVREQRLEKQHVANRRIELQSESSESNGDDDISAVATSEDEVYSPEFDLTKSLLRYKYIEKPNSVELELVTDSTNKGCVFR